MVELDHTADHTIRVCFLLRKTGKKCFWALYSASESKEMQPLGRIFLELDGIFRDDTS